MKTCKVSDLDGVEGDSAVPVSDRMVFLIKEGVIVDTEPTGIDGCYTWYGLRPGFQDDVHEESKTGWEGPG